MVVSLLRRLVRDLDRERLAAEVQRFKRKNAELELDLQAAKLVRRTARRCALVGALASAPAGWLAIAALAPDLSYLISQQSRLVFSLSVLYGRDPSAAERMAEVALCLTAGMGTELAREAILEGIERGLSSRLLSRALRKAGSEGLERLALRSVPVAGAVAGGAINYWAVKGVGNAAIRYYSRG